ncbi:exopolysaccharide biosynthesis polyprenyl glycosylphosphotransferase [Nocardioides panaciterrulae]|uniref:Exopolysaccharide biosynthesis polyprenyl glycosylphosphotransferase n=1 Tax=Nocardioides panaciterrulae TaxID=661492 RepID=A0A7Y9E7Q9_9ACTN|nr:exopolysaccharide biosynthesis polyprenyl glycosylphosphotransferase [Nocardioides panaciterrulae]NYD42776.1 exopolysaccharide biosynthesis polyprenyl glycosylphosphotransferase [Nocardioides panaciterrulae]
MSFAVRKGLAVAPEPATDPAPELAARRPRIAALGSWRVRTLALCLAAADLVTAAVVVLGWRLSGPASGSLLVLTAVPVMWVALLAGTGWYAGPRTRSDSLLGNAVLLAATGWTLAAATGHRLPGEVLALVAALVAAGSLGHRRALRAWASRRGVALPGHRHRAVVVGHPGAVDELAREASRARAEGLEVVGVCLLDQQVDLLRLSDDVPVAAGLGHLAGVVAMSRADTVVLLPCSHLDAATVRRTAWQLEARGTRLLVGTPLHGVAASRARLAAVGDPSLPMVHVRHARLRGPARVVKEIWERLAATLALLLLAPALLVLMVAVRLDSPGPALFRQTRVGRHDRPFSMLKLRTMTVDAEDRRTALAEHNEVDGNLFKIRSDPRVTRLGRLLRRSSLDELPQLINIVRGHMSLVGPRPALPTEVDAYEHDVRRRLVVKPGLTGLWQVSGRSDLPWDEAVRLDQTYVDNWTLRGDLAILARTFGAVVGRRGAY